MSDTKKIRYIDKDEMHLVVGLGNPVLIKKGDEVEFPTEMANRFLKDTKTILIEKKKAKKDKEGKILIPAEYEQKEIPKWEEIGPKGQPREEKPKEKPNEESKEGK